MFAPHFPLGEFTAVSDVKTPNATQLEFAAQLSQQLEMIRHAAGDKPIILTSWIRLDSATQHREGTAIDFRPPAGATERDGVRFVQELQYQGLKFGQFIVYPFSADRHWHISLQTGQSRNAILVQLADGSYVPLSAELAAQFPTTPRDQAPAAGSLAVPAALAGLALLATTRKRG